MFLCCCLSSASVFYLRSHSSRLSSTTTQSSTRAFHPHPLSANSSRIYIMKSQSAPRCHVDLTLFSFPQQLRRNENRLEELRCVQLVLMPTSCRNTTHWHSAVTETSTNSSRVAKPLFRLIFFFNIILLVWYFENIAWIYSGYCRTEKMYAVPTIESWRSTNVSKPFRVIVSRTVFLPSTPRPITIQ